MDPVEAEALRRRLYAPGATEEDRRRYGAVTLEARNTQTVPQSRSIRLRVPIIVLVVAALLVGASSAVLTGRLARTDVTQPQVVRATASPSQPVISAAERVSVSVDGVPTPGQRVRGEGQAVVPIDTSSASFRGGSVVVVLSSADSRPMGWEARRLVTRMDWSSYERVVATSAAVDRRGIATPESAPYTGAPPLWIAVEAPVGAEWILTVALTTGKGPAAK